MSQIAIFIEPLKVWEFIKITRTALYRAAGMAALFRCEIFSFCTNLCNIIPADLPCQAPHESCSHVKVCEFGQPSVAQFFCEMAQFSIEKYNGEFYTALFVSFLAHNQMVHKKMILFREFFQTDHPFYIFFTDPRSFFPSFFKH